MIMCYQKRISQAKRLLFDAALESAHGRATHEDTIFVYSNVGNFLVKGQGYTHSVYNPVFFVFIN